MQELPQLRGERRGYQGREEGYQEPQPARVQAEGSIEEHRRAQEDELDL